MFTIQYEAIDGSHKMQDFVGSSRTKLIRHLALFNRPIMAVYENATVITKALQVDLRHWAGSKTKFAVEFSSLR